MDFNFETICNKNSRAQELLSKKYAHFLSFMAKKDVKGSDWFQNLTLFLAMKRKNDGIFSR